MRRNTMYFSMAVILIITLLFNTGTVINAENRMIDSSTIEKKENKVATSKPHPKFTWGNPGPTSPVLHPG